MYTFKTRIYFALFTGGASNIGSAVATSMNLTNSSEPMGSEHGSVSFKIENPHDMMYYQVSHTGNNLLRKHHINVK